MVMCHAFIVKCLLFEHQSKLLQLKMPVAWRLQNKKRSAPNTTAAVKSQPGCTIRLLDGCWYRSSDFIRRGTYACSGSWSRWLAGGL